MGRLNQPQLKRVGQEAENWREGKTISSLGKQHPLLMPGSAVIESPALSLNEHLSGLAMSLCWGEQAFHYQDSVALC